MIKKWTKKEDEYVKEKYPLSDKNELLLVLDRTWNSIQHRAKKNKIKRLIIDNKKVKAKIWTDEETIFLINNYQFGDKEFLQDKLQRSWGTICQKALSLKLKRLIFNPKNANSIKLINETNEAYYWLGFIMADGHFSNNGQLQINLSIKDLEHLKKFAKFVEYKKELIKPSIDIGYGEIKKWLIDKFNISNNKTCNPCILTNMFNDSFFSFIIGFIDGDGHINKRGYLTIVCHKSWLNNLNYMVKYLKNGNYTGGKINKSGLALVTLTDIKRMNEIKSKIEDLKLPVLTRKWERIKSTRNEKIEIYKKKCFDLFNKGLTPKHILKETNISKSFIYKQFKIYKNGKSGIN